MPLYDIFGPERINFALCLLVIATHLIAARGRE
jgi:hypothetical protein